MGTQPVKATWELLRNVSFFHPLDEAALRALFQACDERSVAKDQVILSQDEPGDALYVIVSGRVKVVIFGEDGKEVILSSLREGDFFGEMSLIDGKPRSASVIALDDTTLLGLSRAVFLAELRRTPDMALALLSEMTKRLRVADQHIGSLALLDVYGRIARAVRDLAAKEGIQAGTNVIIERRPTHQELAAIAGTSRETVSRVMGELIRAEFISIDGKRLILHNEFIEQNDNSLG